MPAFVEPCLATWRRGARRSATGCTEIKFDGYRLQARIEGADVRLLTRSGLDWTDRFGPLATALRHLDLPSALLDGEVVVEDGAGVSSFSALQADLKANRGDRLALYLFDLLHLDGRDTRTLPLRQRKATLKALLDGAGSGGMVRFSDHVGEDGPALKRHACRLGLEGIVSKRADAPYRSGRGGDWVKVKCTARQELVVAGYAPSTVAKRAVGSLVLGVYGEDGTLHHVGRAGTGYTAAEAHDLWAALEPLRRCDPPFAGPLPAEALRGHPVWVEPRLVAEVELRGWTADGAIRHAAFKGLRDDKRAEDVRREGVPEAAPKPARRRAATAAVPPRLTHPDRVLWADVGLTKEGLAGYYSAVAERILPEIAGRPLSLLRGPDGTEGKTFFQKHAWAGLDAAAVRTVSVGDEEALVIDGLPGLVALVQASVLEIHPWGSRMTDPERPDRIVFDLDPGEGVAWVDTVAAAMTVRDRLASLGHRGFVKTTGGKGLHVVLPVVPRVGFDEAKAWARGIAAALESEAPARFTASLAKRARTGRIFIDYLRNGHGATAVAAFSTRARAGAPVAVPVTWEELPSLPPGGGFRVDNILRRLDADTADPWADMDAAARPIAPSAEPRASRRARE